MANILNHPPMYYGRLGTFGLSCAINFGSSYISDFVDRKIGEKVRTLFCDYPCAGLKDENADFVDTRMVEKARTLFCEQAYPDLKGENINYASYLFTGIVVGLLAYKTFKICRQWKEVLIKSDKVKKDRAKDFVKAVIASRNTINKILSPITIIGCEISGVVSDTLNGAVKSLFLKAVPKRKKKQVADIYDKGETVSKTLFLSRAAVFSGAQIGKAIADATNFCINFFKK